MRPCAFKILRWALLSSLLLILVSCSSNEVRFAVIGDYGNGSKEEEDVRDLVESQNPHFIVTLGDNNYETGSADTIDQHIGAYWGNWIYPYKGIYGRGSSLINRFFPALGNHDWATENAKPYLDYFQLPGNERYYTFNWGPLSFFILNSNSEEFDGVTYDSTQANWLKSKLAEAADQFKIVCMHHPPFTSASAHTSETSMQWPFKEWGADIILAGHNHLYERIVKNNLTYIVNGLGGKSLYEFKGEPLEGSQIQYNQDYGALFGIVSSNTVDFKFINRKFEIIDSFQIQRLP